MVAVLALPVESLVGLAWILLSLDVDRGAGLSLLTTGCFVFLKWPFSVCCGVPCKWGRGESTYRAQLTDGRGFLVFDVALLMDDKRVWLEATRSRRRGSVLHFA